MSHTLSRRDCLFGLGQASLGIAAAMYGWHTLRAQEPLAAAKLPPLNRFPRMVQEFFVDRVRQIERNSLAAKAALKTKADAEQYVREVQAKIRQCFGPQPERTPLNARVTGIVERDAYKIEKVIFE